MGKAPAVEEVNDNLILLLENKETDKDISLLFSQSSNKQDTVLFYEMKETPKTMVFNGLLLTLID